MELMIVYIRRRGEHVVRPEPKTGEEFAACDSFAAAKQWVTENFPGVATWHAGPGGVRELKWETHCKCCGAAFDKPYLK